MTPLMLVNFFVVTWSHGDGQYTYFIDYTIVHAYVFDGKEKFVFF